MSLLAEGAYLAIQDAGLTKADIDGMILEEGMDYAAMGIPPRDAQFIESLEFRIEDIARWFRVPPHKIGSLRRATFSNIDAQALEYVTDALMPWLVRWEQEIKRKLIKSSEQDMFAEFVVQGLLRGDQAARSSFYREQFNIGAMSPNDIREMENLNPIGPEGDEYFLQMNMSTLKDIAENNTVADNNSFNRAADIEKIISIQKPLFTDAAQRIVRKEVKAVGRAVKKHANIDLFREWSSTFYSEHKHYILQAFSPLTVTLAQLLNTCAETNIRSNIEFMDFIDEYVKDRAVIAERLYHFEDAEEEIQNTEIENVQDLANQMLNIARNISGAYGTVLGVRDGNKK